MKRTLFKLEPMMRKRRQHLSERKINVSCFVFGQPQSQETIMLKLANPNVGFFLRVKSQFRFRSVSQKKNTYQRCISLFWQVFNDKPSLYKHDLSRHCDEDKFIFVRVGFCRHRMAFSCGEQTIFGHFPHLVIQINFKKAIFPEIRSWFLRKAAHSSFIRGS